MNKSVSLAVVDGSALTEQDVMNGIDAVLEDLWQTSNLSKALGVVSVMDKISKVSGLAKAKLLHGMDRWYSETKQEETRGDTFVDAVEADTGTTPVTTKRYVMAWKYIDECIIPKDVQNRRMDDIIKISTVLEHGYDFSKDDWKELAKASNSSDVREILRKITGKSPRKSGMQIVIDRKGTINVYKDDMKYFVGYLEINSENETIQKAIRRIIDNTGIQEK
jgi:hypothetical protein